MRSKLASLILMTLGFVLCLSARANPSTALLDFKSWKEQQILLAQNQLLRLSLELETQKKSAEPTTDAKPEGHKNKALERFRTKSSRSKLERLEAEVKQSQATVKIAMDLALEDYVSIYLPTLMDAPDTISKLTETLSKDELSRILGELIKRQSDQRDSLIKSSSRGAQVLGAVSANSP